MSVRASSVSLATAAIIVLSLAACHQRMEDAPRFETYEAAPDFEDQRSAFIPPEGIVAWQDAWIDPEAEVRIPITRELLERGSERYAIHCVPCHGYAGYGDGIVVQRGFPPPPSYHIPRLREAPDRHFLDVITLGYGVMFPYATRIAPRDRLAIIAWIRALQLSQHAALEELPESIRTQFKAKMPQ